jgi:hypothetical protein
MSGNSVVNLFSINVTSVLIGESTLHEFQLIDDDSGMLSKYESYLKHNYRSCTCIKSDQIPIRFVSITCQRWVQKVCQIVTLSMARL